MAKGKGIGEGARKIVQIGFAALSNGYLAGFLGKGLYKGGLKRVCLPGLNCYSCPGALGACPIGAMQAVIGGWNHKMSYYAVGFLLFFGALFGRLACGFLCPFGLLQELIHKIPVPGKRKSLPGHRYLKYVKYAVLAILVVLLPLILTDIVGQGAPWYCKTLCPSGTVSGWLQMAISPDLRAQIGWLFTWKSAVCIALLILSLFVHRPFCKYLCPLGAAYALTQKIALYRLRLNENECVRCGKCAAACPMELDPSKNPGGAECVHCRACVRACPKGALRFGLPTTYIKEAKPPIDRGA